MNWKIGMPNLGHTMEEGKVAEWLKSVGDRVGKGEVIAVVETDKSNFDVESPGDGVLLAIEVRAGTTVPVGSVIGLVGTPDETVASAPAPKRDRPFASPAARALAAELGVDLSRVTGSGEGGAITRDDVRAASSAPPAERKMRRAIAEATERAWRTIPHVTLVRRADVTELATARRYPLTAAVVRAAALALMGHRRFNGWLSDGAFTERANADVAVAVTINGGLVMPVVRTAETRSVGAISDDIAALAEAARAGTIAGSQTIEASFTVTTLGRFGIEAFTPIISAPQVAILGVGAIDRVAREAPDGSVRFRSEIALCLTFDHRANDGAEAAEFLAEIADRLADPSSLDPAQ